MEIIFFGFVGSILIFFLFQSIRLVFVSSFQQDLHDFIFNDPNCVNDYSEQEYLLRLKWKQNELDSFNMMMIKFWVWPMSKFIKGTFAEKFFEWKKAGKPKT